jgi:hypothetical protein
VALEILLPPEMSAKTKRLHNQRISMNHSPDSEDQNTIKSSSRVNLHCLFGIALALAFFQFSLTAQARPAPDGDIGNSNTAGGSGALISVTSGSNNTANGYHALFFDTAGSFNTATGSGTLGNTNGGNYNTATGNSALSVNTNGTGNTADGSNALWMSTTGNYNTALGYYAGSNLTTGSYNIDIGNTGVADESAAIRIGTAGNQTATFIAGISGAPVAGLTVVVDGNGQLGTIASSERFKNEIKPMNEASEAIFDLKPVTFRYKNQLDPKQAPQFGLVAEEVEKVDPDLVAHDAAGEVYTVRYEAVNAMLLNEFLKEHRRVEELEAAVKHLQSTIAKQQKPSRKRTTR